MKKLEKIFFALLVFLLTFSFKSYSEVVKQVEVKGNERISLETVIIFADITLGDNYEAAELNQIIKKLYATNFFSNISIKLDNGLLNITVKENPIVNEIVFNGENAKKYIEAISNLLTLREKTSFVKNYIKSDINLVREFYRQLGFYFAKIDLEVEQLKKNRVNLIYTISKGDKAKISKIYFLGDKKIRDTRLKSIITSEEATFWKVISRNVYLNKGRVELDKRLLVNFYKNKGYYDVDITSSNVEYSEGEGFVLSFNIDAGQRYRFSKFSLEVAPQLDQSAFASLENEFDKIVGDYYSQKKLTNILEKIDKLSEIKELQFINHGITETLQNDTIEVVVRIYEGQKFTIERINIVGNNVTNDSVIRSELIVDEGDPFSVLLVNKSINQLKSRNIFGKIEKRIIEGSAPNLKILEIEIEEKATGEISAGAGIGTQGTSFMFAVSENNWLGRGIKLNTAFNVSEEKVSGNIAVSNPNYNFTGNSVYANLDISSTDLKESSGYASSKTGFGFGTAFERYENIYVAPALSFTYEDIEVQSSASSAIRKMDGTFSNIDFHYSIIADKRNQSFQPSEGHRIKFSQSIPLVLDNSSLLNSFNLSSYHTLSEDVIGSVKFFAQSIHGLNDEDVRLTNRLHVPSQMARGFVARKIGPKDGVDYVGGNYLTAIGFAAQLPNLLPESMNTDISIFMDNANIWHVDYSSSVDDASAIRSSIGIAANVSTLVGPLTFTLAQALNSHKTDKTEVFNFRLGTSF